MNGLLSNIITLITNKSIYSPDTCCSGGGKIVNKHALVVTLYKESSKSSLLIFGDSCGPETNLAAFIPCKP